MMMVVTAVVLYIVITAPTLTTTPTNTSSHTTQSSNTDPNLTKTSLKTTTTKPQQPQAAPVGNSKPVWAVLPMSWCRELLMVKREGNDLYCEANDNGTGPNYREWSHKDRTISNPKWLKVTNNITNTDWGFLSWLVVNDGKCEPHCGNTFKVQDRRKVFNDSPGKGCDQFTPTDGIPYSYPAK
jgi:hypothetical protein